MSRVVSRLLMGDDGHVESGFPRTHLEHEAKLTASPTFRMPKLDHVAPGLWSDRARQELLTAVYFDTPDLALARSGITLRHRTGESDGGRPWTLKIPRDHSATTLIRNELTFDGGSDRVPDAAADLVRAYTRGRPLHCVARLETTRNIVALRDATGHLIVEVVDDVVSVHEGSRHTSTFREIEVELHDEGPHRERRLQLVIDRLVGAGASASPPLPKLVRALASRASAPADVHCEPMNDRDWKHADARTLVRHTLGASIQAMIHHDLGVRLDEDPEDLHAFRVATRQLRSNLRTFSPLLSRKWTADLRLELAWIGTSLGAVRECDVLADRLQQRSPVMPSHFVPALDGLLVYLAEQRDSARKLLLADMRSSRYDRLIDRLCEAANHPAFDPGAGKTLRASASVTGPKLVRRTWRTLERAMRAGHRDPSIEVLHKVRIRAKRCRYAAEALVPLMGKTADRFARQMALVQGTLGDLNDGDAAQQWLRRAAELLPRTEECVDDLLAIERDARAQTEHEWLRVSRYIEHHHKLVRWLQPR